MFTRRKIAIILFLVTALSSYLPSQQSYFHSATVKWTGQNEKEIKANPKTRIEKYFVFRAAATRGNSGRIYCGPDFEKIAEVYAPTTKYVDKSVQADHAYCYRVTAFRAGLQSLPSAPKTAVIPADK